MSSTWLTDREMAAWRSYIETYGDLSAALERDLAEHELTLGDYQVLVYLSEAEDEDTDDGHSRDARRYPPARIGDQSA